MNRLYVLLRALRVSVFFSPPRLKSATLLLTAVLLLAACGGQPTAAPTLPGEGFPPVALATATRPAPTATSYPVTTFQPAEVALNAADWSLAAGPAGDDWVSALAVDGYGNVWFSSDKGIWRYDGSGWRVYTTDDGLPTNDTWGLALTPGGAPLAGVCGGVFRLTGERWENVDPQAPGSTGKACFQALAAGEDGSVWMGMVNADFGSGSGPGVLRFDGQAWLSYNDSDETVLAGFTTEPAVLPGSDVALTLVSTQGDLWALMDAGLARFEGAAWTVYDASNSPLNTRLWGLVEDQDGGLWVGTQSGAARFDGASWTVYAPADGLEGLMVPLAVEPEGAVWFHTNQGLLRLDGSDWQRFELPHELAGERAWAGVIGPDGALWLGTWGGGAFRYLPGAPALTEVVPVPTPVPTAISVRTPPDVSGLPAGDAGRGAALYTAQRCIECHGELAQQQSLLLGPWLGELAQTAAGRQPGYSAQQYLYESLTDPDAYLAPECPIGACAGGLMPFFSQLSDQELADLIAYLLAER